MMILHHHHRLVSFLSFLWECNQLSSCDNIAQIMVLCKNTELYSISLQIHFSFIILPVLTPKCVPHMDYNSSLDMRFECTGLIYVEEDQGFTSPNSVCCMCTQCTHVYKQSVQWLSPPWSLGGMVHKNQLPWTQCCMLSSSFILS